ncbi:MAG: hypothetical protein OXQ31_26085, partial [Spirochaetaceae bacterium]|nr:hypothetical protein [Spirochaetaceae bacterium]
MLHVTAFGWRRQRWTFNRVWQIRQLGGRGSSPIAIKLGSAASTSRLAMSIIDRTVAVMDLSIQLFRLLYTHAYEPTRTIPRSGPLVGAEPSIS